VLAWTAVLVSAVGLGCLRWRRGWRQRLVAVAAVAAVLSLCLVKVNAFYGYRPTLAAALGIPAENQVDLTSLPPRPLVVAAPHEPLDRTWRAPTDMPRNGLISAVQIPGTHSHFRARTAWLYLPPAYLGSQRARLPVLVLIPGQPGGPEDWLFAGRLAEVMDAFAAAHAGLAPVVVVPDVTGSALGNTLCVDSRLGGAETYLAEDVPAWLSTALQVDTSHLAIGGFSFGGTCALQLALRRPGTYPTFLDISGQARPDLGGLQRTIAGAFGGDAAAFARVNPLDEMRTGRYAGSAGLLVVGRDDDVYRPQAELIAAAARSSVAVALWELPGGHSWAIASEALTRSLAWIGGRTGLLEPTPAVNR
jgi:S-formylglutathione hydrolase FrmB